MSRLLRAFFICFCLSVAGGMCFQNHLVAAQLPQRHLNRLVRHFDTLHGSHFVNLLISDKDESEKKLEVFLHDCLQHYNVDEEDYSLKEHTMRHAPLYFFFALIAVRMDNLRFGTIAWASAVHELLCEVFAIVHGDYSGCFAQRLNEWLLHPERARAWILSWLVEQEQIERISEKTRNDFFNTLSALCSQNIFLLHGRKIRGVADFVDHYQVFFRRVIAFISRAHQLLIQETFLSFVELIVDPTCELDFDVDMSTAITEVNDHHFVPNPLEEIFCFENLWEIRHFHDRKKFIFENGFEKGLIGMFVCPNVGVGRCEIVLENGWADSREPMLEPGEFADSPSNVFLLSHFKRRRRVLKKLLEIRSLFKDEHNDFSRALLKAFLVWLSDLQRKNRLGRSHMALIARLQKILESRPDLED